MDSAKKPPDGGSGKQVKRPPEDREGMLVYKNQRLAERVEEQRREIRQLEARVEEYDKQQEEYQETLMTVNRLWNQLNQDIAFMVARATGKDAFRDAAAARQPALGEEQPVEAGEMIVPAVASNGPTAAAAADTNGDGEGPTVDSFVERLLRGTDRSNLVASVAVEARARQAKLVEGYSDVESGLRVRMAGTSSALASLLDALDAERNRCSSLRKQLAAASVTAPAGNAAQAGDAAAAPAGGDAGPSGRDVGPPDATAGTDASTLGAGLRAQLDAQRALARAADQHAKLLQDQVDRDRMRIRQLETVLADQVETVAVAQRKLAAVQATHGGGAVASPLAVAVGSGAAAAAAGVEEGQLEPGERAHEDGLLAVELQEVRRLLDKRNAELEADRTSIVRLQRELRDARMALQDEGHVLQTRLYQLAQKQINAMGADLDRLNGTIDALQRDLGIAMQTQQDLKIRAESGDYAKRTLRDAEARIADVENKRAAAVAARNDLEVQLLHERERFGNASSVEELSVMVGTLQKENALMKGHVARHKVATERIDAAAKEVAAAQAKVEAKQAAVDDLRRQLEERDVRIQQLLQQQEHLQSTVGELRLFVEVLLRFCDDPRDAAEVRLSERQLQQQLDELQKRMEEAEQGALPATQKAQAEASEARQQVADLRSTNEALSEECSGLRKELQALQGRVQELKDEAEAYMGEIETIGSAYEDMQAQNTRLLAGITERDELNNRLTADKMRSQQQQQQLSAECGGAAARVHAAETQAESLRRRVQDMEGQLQAALSEATAARDGLRSHGLRAESLQRDLRDKEDQLAKAHTLLESSQRQCADRKRGLEEESDRLQRERSKRQRLDEDLKVAQARLGKLRGQTQTEGAEASRESQEELQGLRSLLRCSVCSERRKDTIITKCFHMFCSRCIQRNLETRHRKCPGCNVGFGTNDVKSIYFS